jgi:anti-anti-sigma factor
VPAEFELGFPRPVDDDVVVIWPGGPSHLSEDSTMADAGVPLLEVSRVDGVLVVEILSREFQGPDAAKALGEQLGALLRSGETRLLLNFGRTQVMSSTAFGTLLYFWKQVDAAHGELRICSMAPAVRFGADILSLGQYIPIHDDEPSALAAFAAEGEGEAG